MSYILDALKKSERERTLVRGVGFGDAGRRWSKRGDWSLGAIVIGVIGLAAVVIVGVWLRSRAVSTEAPPTAALPVARVTPHTYNTEVAPLPAQTKITREPSTPLVGATSVSTADEGAARFISAMSPDFQRSLPAMTVNIHVYAPRESQRILYINNRQYRHGDEIPGGVFVEEIVPDGVVLQFRGQHFKLPRPS